MSVFTDPIFLRSVERILLVAAAIYLGFLGYKLFLYGIASGRSASNPQLQVPTALYSGVAPGLFFMFVAGAVVLVVSLTGNPPAPRRGLDPARLEQRMPATGPNSRNKSTS